MIELADITLAETRGDFDSTQRIMNEDTSEDWMLRSYVFVSNELTSGNYLLHFWKNGCVMITDTDRPLSLDSSDEDLRELSGWCQKSGWNRLMIDDKLLLDRRAYEFWRRAFIAGLVHSQKLEKYEQDEMDRITEVYLKEEKEDGP